MDGPGRTFRRVAIVVAVSAIFAVAAATASAAPLLWVINKDANVVSTVDPGAGKIVGAPIPVGERPESIAITPNGRFALVGNYDGKSVTVINTATHAATATVPLPGHAGQVAISPSGALAYVAIEGTKEVSIIDIATAKTVGSIPLAGEAGHVAFAPDGRHAYATSGEESIAVLDTATAKVVGSPIPVGKFPQSIVFTPSGTTAYVSAAGSKAVAVINTALGQVVGTIPIAGEPEGLAVSPNGQRLYVADESDGAVSVYETEGDRLVGKPIATGTETEYIAITPDGRTAYVSAAGDEVVMPISLATDEAGKPIPFVGETADLAVTPDQSPTAAFAVPSATATQPTVFSGAASTDPDGSVVAWNWTFGDGGVATGVSPTHTYGTAGNYAAKLGVVDNEGCGEPIVFTGRTAYCSGGASTVTNTLAVEPPPAVPIAAPAGSNRFRFGRLIHNRRNGTARLQVRLPTAGAVLLLGPQVHLVRRKIGGTGTLWLTIHARVELNKRLKKTLRAPVRVRVTFTPTGGEPRTKARSIVLQRAPRKHRRHGR